MPMLLTTSLFDACLKGDTESGLPRGRPPRVRCASALCRIG